nr:MAG TPA: hypothetical protein [Caudoviricetes sp.]
MRENHLASNGLNCSPPSAGGSFFAPFGGSTGRASPSRASSVMPK